MSIILYKKAISGLKKLRQLVEKALEEVFKYFSEHLRELETG